MTARRRGVLAAVVAGLGGWLAGCGEDADAADTAGTETGEADPPTDTEPATDADPPADESTLAYAEDLSVTAADGYVAWGVGRSDAFVLEYEVTNRRTEHYAVDVLLYPAATFASYRAVVTGDAEGPRPTALDGSATGVASTTRRSVALEAGTYYLVVDNSGTGEGESTPEGTRRVRIEATARPQ